MCGYKTLKAIQNAFAGNMPERIVTSGTSKLFSTAFTFVGLVSLFLLLSSTSHALTYTVNIFISSSTVNPAALQKDLLSTLTTGQYLGSSVSSPFFPNTYSVTVTGRNPIYQGPQVSSPLITLDSITNKLITISTYTHLTGYAQGMLYERDSNASNIGGFMALCGNATNFGLVKVDSTTCNDVLGFMDNWIIHQTSGIAVIPNPPPGF